MRGNYRLQTNYGNTSQGISREKREVKKEEKEKDDGNEKKKIRTEEIMMKMSKGLGKERRKEVERTAYQRWSRIY